MEGKILGWVGGAGKRTGPMREIVNAICDIARGGVTWRLLPAGFPPGRESDCGATRTAPVRRP